MANINIVVFSPVPWLKLWALARAPKKAEPPAEAGSLGLSKNSNWLPRLLMSCGEVCTHLHTKDECAKAFMEKGP
jgi:hypothetical protein